MPKELSTPKKILFLITLFLSNVIIMNDYVILPTVNVLYEMFASQTALVNFIVSGPYLLIVVFSLLAGKLCSKTSLKNVFVIGCAIAAVGGIFMIIIKSALWMCLMRSLIAIGYSFVQVVSISLIGQVYTDEKKRGSIIGFYNAAMTGIGAIMSMVAGNLATISIYAAYKIYWVYALVLIMAIFFIPALSNANSETITNEAGTEAKTKESFGGAFWKRIALYVLFTIAFSVANFMAAVYVAENALGTEAMAGYCSTVLTCVSMIFALIFGVFYGKMKGRTSFLGYLLTLLGLAILYFFPSKVTCYLAFALLGAGYSTIFSFGFAHFPTLVPASRVNDAIAYVTASFSLAGFASTYVATILMSAFGWTLTQSLIVFVILMVAVIVLDFIVSTTEKKSLPQENA